MQIGSPSAHRLEPPRANEALKARFTGSSWTSIGASVVVMAICVALVDTRQLVDQLSRVEAHWLAVALVLHLTQVLLLGLRWSMISTRLGAPLGFVRAAREYALSLVVNQILPGGAAGDGLRTLRRAEDPGQGLLSSLEAVAIDRLSGQLVLWLFVLVGLPLTFASGVASAATFVWLLLGATGVTLISWAALSLVPALRVRRDSILAFLRRAVGVLLHPKRALGHASLSALLVSLSLAQVWVAARALGIELGVWRLVWLGPLMLVAASLPSFLGGWGIRESASALLFAAVGMGSGEGVAVSVVYGAFALLSSLPGLLVLLYRDGDEPAVPVGR